MPVVRIAFLVALTALAPGCKWLGGDRAAEPLARAEPDPLFGMRRIEPQSGVLGRDPLAGGNRDPLTVKPASRDRSTGANDLPPRKSNDRSQRAPYRPSAADSPAGLAGGREYDADLTINRDEVGATQLAQTMADLKLLGATVEPPIEQAGRFTVTATVPIGGEPPGSRRYTGSGPTAEKAAQSALEQVRSGGQN